MKIYTLPITLFFCFLAGSLLGQITISGKVLDQRSKAPIAYANIGILNTSVGTLSNEDGSFKIKIPKKLQSKKLLFSTVGYEQQYLSLNGLTNDTSQVIYLKEKVEVLKNVTVTARQVKKKSQWFGHKKPLLLNGTLHTDTTSAGAAIALLIEKEDPDYEYVETVSLWVALNTLPEFKIRVHFLEVDSANGNQPGEEIFNESIVQKSEMRKGWMTFDLSDYQYKLSQKSFFLMFEWILDDEDRIYISNRNREYMEQNPHAVRIDSVLVDGERVANYSVGAGAPVLGTFLGVTGKARHLREKACYFRENSFGQWHRSPSILSAKILLSNQPEGSPVLTSEDNKGGTIEQQLDYWGKNFLEKYDLSGLQLTVSKKGEEIFSSGYGYADTEQRLEVNPQTRFRVASVSKTMTSAALMKLASQGKLRLDTTIAIYVPSYKQKEYTITARQLAGHLSGIRDYYEISLDEIFVKEHYPSATSAIKIFEDDSLKFSPGTQFLYSTYGYNLLGAVIEGASKENYLDYMQQNIWSPLAMANTYGDVFDSLMINKSKFYYYNGKESEPYDLSYNYPGGGLISNTSDLVRFGNSLLGNEFLSSTYKNQLFEEQSTLDGTPTAYGLGWYLGQDQQGHRVWYHAGELPSSGSMLVLYPDDDIVLAILSNSPILSEADDGFNEEIESLGKILYKH